MLIVHAPPTRSAEREYICRVLLGEFLGLDYRIVYERDRKNEVLLVLDQASPSPAGPRSGLRMPDVLLSIPQERWLKPASLPVLPLDRFVLPGGDFAAADEELPVIYGRKTASGSYMEWQDDNLYLGLDVFGSSLFMLTRYEEVVQGERKFDRHGRFPARNSLAWRESFLHLPVVNAYVECLWELLTRLGPGLVRKKREPTVRLSHDVDFPFYVYGRSRISMFREVAMDLVRRKDTEAARHKGAMLLHPERLDQDPYNTFGWLMDLSEQAGLRSAFYFIAKDRYSPSGIDGNYTVNDPAVGQLLRDIHARGHEIGLHPSYRTFLNPALIRKQFERLQEVAAAHGVYSTSFGGRQHYLRWRAPETWQFWEDAGLNYDSTVGYAEHTGFRAGVCYEYPVFNLKTRRELALRERPLIAMDQTLLHPEYMGLTPDQAYEALYRLYRQCRKYNGEFTLLWHNSQLLKSSHRALYHKLLVELLKPDFAKGEKE